MIKLIIITLLSICLLSCSDIITPVEATRSAITETYVRIDLYAKQNQSLPDSLEILPKRDGYANRILDGWDRPLQYHVDQGGIITIASLGKDGKTGGTGENADISIRYYSKRKDGSLWAGSELWIVEAEIKK